MLSKPTLSLWNQLLWTFKDNFINYNLEIVIEVFIFNGASSGKVLIIFMRTSKKTGGVTIVFKSNFKTYDKKNKGAKCLNNNVLVACRRFCV